MQKSTIHFDGYSRQIALIAEAHGGFVTREELLAIGLTQHAIQHRIRRGYLVPHPDLRGVFGVGHIPTASSARAHAALLAVGPRSALAGWAAVNNYRNAVRWVEPFTVITATQASPRGVTTLHSTRLRASDVDVVHGLSTVSPALACLHVAPDLSKNTLIRVIDDFRINDGLSDDQLEVVAQRFPRQADPLKRALDDLQDEPTRSGWEQEWPPFAAHYNLASYVMNAYVLTYRVDVLMDGLIIEFDGWGSHGGREAFEHDREEIAEILAVTGIPVIRITHRQFHGAPAIQAERIRAIVAQGWRSGIVQAMPASHLTATNLNEGLVSDEVELYQRTYMTLLRSSGETRLRVLEPSHRAMGSSLHALADSDELDLGAFLYAVRRLPGTIAGARLVVMGQETEDLVDAGLPVGEWTEVEAPARRRRWYDSSDGVLGVLIASASDVDDLIPTLVAYQIEWNKLHRRLRSQDLAAIEDHSALCGGSPEDWARLKDAWGEEFEARIAMCAASKLRLAVRMLGGSNVGFSRLTRRWWAPVEATIVHQGFTDRPLYFVSSNTHSLVNIVSGAARRIEPELVRYAESLPADNILAEELARFRAGESRGSWENFLYFTARRYWSSHPSERRELEQAAGVHHRRSVNGMRVPVQVMGLAQLDPAGLDPRLGTVDAARLAASEAVVVNIDYPLGLAAYNILREVAVGSSALRGVYILGKAATLNADVGDVMISNVVHDEHSGNTYWLDNVFSVGDLSGDLRFGTGLDNQRAVTVKSTFLQNRAYLDFYYREAFTVVEMEAGPFCSAVYEMTDQDRHPVGEAVNFSKLPVDLGVIHYASDTPYTQARTLGARGLDYYGMDSTYASSLAILRRILRLEGALT